MPRDEYQRAKRSSIARRASNKAERTAAAKQRARTYKNTFKKKKVKSTHKFDDKDFPKHQLNLQPDGSYLSPVYTFDVSRWNK